MHAYQRVGAFDVLGAGRRVGAVEVGVGAAVDGVFALGVYVSFGKSEFEGRRGPTHVDYLAEVGGEFLVGGVA